MQGMNKLPLSKRVQILSMLVEGSSMRSISRVVGVRFNTVTKLLVDAGLSCAAYHDCQVRNVWSKRVQWALSLYFVFYNFVRIHKTLRTSPAMTAGVTDRLWSMEDIVGLVDDLEVARITANRLSNWRQSFVLWVEIQRNGNVPHSEFRARSLVNVGR